jgi:hypothetical protein
MEPPDELMTQSFLPALRQLVAVRLRSLGLSQARISSLLGITQASVSMYLSSDPGKAYASLSWLSVSSSEADMYADMLAKSVTGGAVDGIRTLRAIWTGLLGSGSVCAAHRSLYPSLAECDVCMVEYGPRRGARSEAMYEVSEAAKLLEASPTFAAVMPEVSVNIACTAGDASTPADVVAIPGRIVRVKDRAKAMLPPAWGASAHMSRVLLLVRRKRPDVRACINLRYDKQVARTIRSLGLREITIGGYSFPKSDDPTSEALENRLLRSRGGFDVVVDLGGRGIEPNVYLFGRGAREVADLALKISELYSSG